uniref:Putative secreted protein n=1 Tax=Ixodes ricinus TaxID=34613 RepID=A0A6B0V2V8_IXORI
MVVVVKALVVQLALFLVALILALGLLRTPLLLGIVHLVDVLVGLDEVYAELAQGCLPRVSELVGEEWVLVLGVRRHGCQLVLRHQASVRGHPLAAHPRLRRLRQGRLLRLLFSFDADGVQVEELAASLGPVGLLGEQDGVVRRVHPRCRCAVTAGDHHGDNGAPFRPKRHTHTHALTRAGTTRRQHDASTR